ncbi:MAG: SWIM zinc finger family protein [Aquificaceae bacterium]|nr:MAG: SWIM zinc finger family protein [Aquificaceae bacterium]
MEFSRKYQGKTKVSHSGKSSNMSFVPDALREPTFFVGDLNKHIPFREAMSALHHVVVSDLRFKPKDKTDYKAWLKEQEDIFLAEAMSAQADKKEKIKELRAELRQIQTQESKALAPYYKAQSKYFNYLYKHDYDAWYVLDPVISVHPDSIFFECFSQDESSYGKLSCDYEIFKNISEHSYGTTNIDYSSELYQEFQKIRDYKDTQFMLDPSGFEVRTDLSDDFKEEKIDLPDSWVRGFLQVSSAMSLPFIQFDLHPMDIYNLLLILKRHKERASPRSIRFILTPNQPVKMLIEPWSYELVCHRSLYHGNKQEEVRIWGRRRLFILERLLPLVKHFKVSLLGTGLPSFWVAEMQGMTFTLGLSGWSANDFSRMGNFDLMAPRGEVDSITAEKVFHALQSTWVESASSLAKRLALDELTVKSALGVYSQYGRVLYDMDKNLYRIRELSKDPLPMDKLRFSNEREEKASNFIKAKLVTVLSKENQQGRTIIKGKVIDDGNSYQPEIVIDADMRLIDAKCSCHFYIQNKMNQGPCEHMLAIRLS